MMQALRGLADSGCDAVNLRVDLGDHLQRLTMPAEPVVLDDTILT